MRAALLLLCLLAAPTQTQAQTTDGWTADRAIDSAAPTPADHAADRYYDAAVMDAARRALTHAHGGEGYSMLMGSILERQVRSGVDGYRWEGRASTGGDIHRFIIKTEGEGDDRQGVGAAEVQGLYSRAVGPYFDLQAGVRQDLRPTPMRTYATVGIEGLAPYGLEVQAALFVSTKGEVLARGEADYDLRLTQRLILQPRAELDFAARDIRERGVGSGLSNAELGLRLRYEVTRTFAPYVGVSYDRRFGDTAGQVRLNDGSRAETSIVAGVRSWF